jgi:hypothetical protein
MRARQDYVVKEREKQLAHKKSDPHSAERRAEEKKRKEQKKVRLIL